MKTSQIFCLIPELIQAFSKVLLTPFIVCLFAVSSLGQIDKGRLTVGGLINASKDKNQSTYDVPSKPANSYVATLNSWKINPDILVAYGLSSKLHIGFGFQYAFRQDKLKAESAISVSEGPAKIAKSFAIGPLFRYYITNQRIGLFAQFQKLWGKQSTSQDFLYAGYDIKKGRINIFQAGIGGYYSVNRNINIELMVSYKNELIDIKRRIDEGSSVQIINITDKTDKILINVGTTFLINTK